MNEDELENPQELPEPEVPELPQFDPAPTDTTPQGPAEFDERQNDTTRMMDKVSSLESEIGDLKEQLQEALGLLREVKAEKDAEESVEITEIQEKAHFKYILDQLQSQIDTLNGRVEPQSNSYNEHNFPVFLAREDTNGSNTFNELLVNGGALVVSADSLRRQASADSLTSALMDLGVDDVLALQVLDLNSGTPCWRNFRIKPFNEGTVSSPKTLGASCIGGTAPDTVSFDREADNKPLEEWLVTNVKFDEATGVWYQEKRKHIWPRYLAPKTVSSEFECQIIDSDTCPGA